MNKETNVEGLNVSPAIAKPMLAAVKMSEFYEKYYKITLPNGEQVSPTLTDEERAIMDKAQELGVAPYVRMFTRKLGYKYEVHPEVKAALNCG